jgi:hypothetical protein
LFAGHLIACSINQPRYFCGGIPAAMTAIRSVNCIGNFHASSKIFSETPMIVPSKRSGEPAASVKL